MTPEAALARFEDAEEVDQSVVPTTGCSEATAGTSARINYTADYYFFTTR